MGFSQEMIRPDTLVALSALHPDPSVEVAQVGTGGLQLLCFVLFVGGRVMFFFKGFIVVCLNEFLFCCSLFLWWF